MLTLIMPTQEKNSGQTLESWKQIAAHLNRSERTVRRWEVAEGLPVRRREHQNKMQSSPIHMRSMNGTSVVSGRNSVQHR